MDFQHIIPELHYSAVRSRGPGGQNVNKVASAAILTWGFADSDHLTQEQKGRLRSRLSGWLNRQGELCVRSDEFRDLARNKARCLEKLVELVEKALHVPKPRKPTRPTKASQARKRDAKERRSLTKSLRKKIR